MLSLVATNTFANQNSTQNEQQCLAKVIYHEARGETLIGKTAVAKVVLNRKTHKKFPKTICSVVNQVHVVNKRKKVCQFSWVCSKNKIDVSSQSWKDAKVLSSNILNNRISLPNLGPDVLFFRSKHSFKKFDKSYRLVKKIDNSLFYEKRWV